MINSVPALCRSLSASLRKDVLPHLQDSFARSQLFAAIYVLNNLERQAAWSGPVLARQAALAEQAIADVCDATTQLGVEFPEMPQTTNFIEAVDEARRDAANARICALFDWFADAEKSSAMTPELRALEAQLLDQAKQTVNEERRQVASSMMREMSGGSD